MIVASFVTTKDNSVVVVVIVVVDDVVVDVGAAAAFALQSSLSIHCMYTLHFSAY